MVCYANASGNSNARRTSRAKHYVVFDRAEDNSAALRARHPSLGWRTVNGLDALPFSIAARLILVLMIEEEHPEVALFAEFPTAQLLSRLWGAVVPLVNVEADDIFSEVARAGWATTDKTPFTSVDGDWEAVEGQLGEWEGNARWVDNFSRGDAFADKIVKSPGLAGAELIYLVGPYMLNEFRAEDSHFAACVGVVGKLFQSDDDESVCDGIQLACEVAVGMRGTVWPPLFNHVTKGFDDTPAATKGSERMTELRDRCGYAEARNTPDQNVTKYIVRILPSAMQQTKSLPSLSSFLHDVASGYDIVEHLTEIGTALQAKEPQRIHARWLKEMDALLDPIFHIVSANAVLELPLDERLTAVIELIDTHHLSVKGASKSVATTSTLDGDKSTASSKLLLTQLTKPESILLLSRLSEYRQSAAYEPITYLEMAHSGRWTPEQRHEKVSAALTQTGSARRDALAAIEADDKRAPVPALLQLAWGHTKSLEGYPELQDIADLGQTIMPDVLARVCARAYSADGISVPLSLRFARAVKLCDALKGRKWEETLDFINDGDAVMLSYIEGGQGGEVDRVPTAEVYTDISQVARVRRIGTNVLAFFGVLDSPTKSWRQLVSTCEHALMSVPASDAVKRARVGKAMQRFIQRCLGDVGKRLDLVRYSSKHDAVGPRSLLAPGRGGPAEEFAEAMARVLDDQKRKRSEVADDESSMTKVRVPSEAKGSRPAAAAAKKLKFADALAPDTVSARAPAEEQTAARAQLDTARTQEVAGEYNTAIKLQLKPKPQQPPKAVTVHVNAKAAARWLTDKGTQRPCLGFLFGHACKQARRWASCPHQGKDGHSEEADGSHAIPDGWNAAAAQFMLPADRKLVST